MHLTHGSNVEDVGDVGDVDDSMTAKGDGAFLSALASVACVVGGFLVLSGGGR